MSNATARERRREDTDSTVPRRLNSDTVTPRLRDPFNLGSINTALRRYILTILFTGLLCIAACVTAVVLDDNADGNGSQFLLITLFYICVNLLPIIELPRGKQQIKYRFNEVPTLIGVALLPPYMVPLAALIAELQPLLRDYFDPDEKHNRFKIPFNLGAQAITLTLVVSIAQFGAPPLNLLFAATTSAFLGDVLIFRGMHLAGGPTVAEHLRTGWETRVAIPAVVALLCSGLLALAAQFGGPFVVAVIPVAVIVLYLTCAAAIAIYRDRAAWQKLEEVIVRDLVRSSVSGEPNENLIITAALSGALSLFILNRVEIILTDPDFTYSQDNVPHSRVHARPHSPGEKIEVPQDSDLISTVRLDTQGNRSPGWLVLYHRRKAPDGRRAERERLITTFAAQVASNIMIARSYQHLRTSADQRAHEALHDGLTSLGNREMLYERAPRMLAESSEAGKMSALLLFDLDGFKRINDTLGHNAGDVLLREVSDRTKNSVRASDLAVRLGGDEFAVLATDLDSASDSEAVANNLIEHLLPPVLIEGMRLTVEASIGIAIYGQDADDIHSLLRVADVAMYEAKNKGRGTWCRYNASTNVDNTAEQLVLTTDLRNALDNDELVLHYQPQVNTATSQIIGMEALVRWNHPELGLIPPHQFVHLAEHSGMIRAFTLTIMDKAVADHARLRRLTGGSTMSVNLSARNLLDQGLPEDVARILARYGVPPTELVLEITETYAPTDNSAVERVLTRLSSLGCQISLDDFGTGYSSLSSLRRSTFSEVKIDRDFVKDILVNPAAATMVRSIVDIAHGHACKVVAEGVENDAVLERLREMNCDISQGYLIARPAPLLDVERWIRTWKAEHPIPLERRSDSKIVDFEAARRAARESAS